MAASGFVFCKNPTVSSVKIIAGSIVHSHQIGTEFDMMFMKMVKKAIAISKQKKVLVAMLIANARLMKSGWYSFDGHIASRTFSQGLGGLMKAKGYKIDPSQNAMVKFFIRTAYLAIPPVFMRLSGGGDGTGTQLLVTMQGNVKIFDFFSRTVLTIFQEKSGATLLLAARKRLSPSLCMTDMVLHPTGQGVIEPLCKGDFFSDIDPISQSDVFRSIINNYSLFFRSKRPSYRSREHFQGLFSTALELPLPLPMRQAVLDHRDSLIDRLVACPFYDCHGDIHGKNVIVDNQKITILDLDTVCERPFFFDIISIVYHEALTGRMKMLDDLLEGLYSTDIRNMTDATAVDFEIENMKTVLLYFLYKVTNNPCSLSGIITDKARITNIARPVLMRLEKLSCQ